MMSDHKYGSQNATKRISSCFADIHRQAANDGEKDKDKAPKFISNRTHTFVNPALGLIKLGN